MNKTLKYVQDIERLFAYASPSAKCIASFVYENYFADIELIDGLDSQKNADKASLDCIFTIYLVLMLCHNIDEQDVCLDIEGIAGKKGAFYKYKEYEHDSINRYRMQHSNSDSIFSGIDFDCQDFADYKKRLENGNIECVAVECVFSNIEEKPFVLSYGRLYLRRSFLYETFIAQYIVSKRENKKELPEYSDMLNTVLPELFDMTNVKNESNHQLLCALLSIYQGFTIISGGPGTGKTTTVLKLLFLHIYLNKRRYANSGRDLDIRLCAPTGKAAGRMRESIFFGLEDLMEAFKNDKEKLDILDKIPREACTIHSLIGVKPHSSRAKYNENNKLSVDILIVDEVSMVDMALFVKLIKALDSKTVVIMLGDKDQLCSVEAGAVLGDICQALFKRKIIGNNTLNFISAVSGIDKETIKKENSLTEFAGLLKKSYRFKEGSSIFKLASCVNTPISDDFDAQMKIESLGRCIADIRSYNGDVRLKSVDDILKTDGIKELILDITRTALAEIADDGRQNYSSYLKILEENDFFVSTQSDSKANVRNVFTAMNRFRVLCSNREGDLGCNRLSYEIENAIKSKYGFSQSEFFPGRIILINRNNSVLNLNNGDVGLVAYDAKNIGTDKERNLYVWFISPCRQGSYKPVRIPIAFLDSYESAFCMTIHKSQGSEYEHVLISLSLKFNPVLTKELIYTAITRARNYITMIYTDDILQKACCLEVMRQSGLEMRLGDLAEAEINLE